MSRMLLFSVFFFSFEHEGIRFGDVSNSYWSADFSIVLDYPVFLYFIQGRCQQQYTKCKVCYIHWYRYSCCCSSCIAGNNFFSTQRNEHNPGRWFSISFGFYLVIANVIAVNIYVYSLVRPFHFGFPFSFCSGW